VTTGRLAGLGTTEQIYAVRFSGDIAYVVTFRRTDPLYAIDLADPAPPGCWASSRSTGTPPTCTRPTTGA
jgi:uncharacterized secreted protein with C-terminal beta-propeller domain